ncbi:hypothetical protein Q9Q99_05710 [Curtobacterium flaccumfaciens]|nr:hypothetical protein Q9Q99_05710 [Curtobacterium flaccumfaciens]
MPPSTRPSGPARGVSGATVSIGVVDRGRRRMRRWLRRGWRPIAYLWRRSLMFPLGRHHRDDDGARGGGSSAPRSW